MIVPRCCFFLWLFLHGNFPPLQKSGLTALSTGLPDELFGIADVVTRGLDGASPLPGLDFVREGDDVEEVPLPQLRQDGEHGLLRLTHTDTTHQSSSALPAQYTDTSQ